MRARRRIPRVRPAPPEGIRRLREPRAPGDADARRRDRGREGREGAVREGLRRPHPGRRRARGCAHPVPDRVQHQGIHDRGTRDAGGRRQALLGRPRHQAPLRLPAVRPVCDARVHGARPRDAPERSGPRRGRPAVVPLELRPGGDRLPHPVREAGVELPQPVRLRQRPVHRRGRGRTGRAAPHGVDGGRLQVVPLDSVDNIAPAGGIASNVTDLAKWVRCRLDSGRYAAGRLFGARQAREMWSGQTILPIADPPPPLAALRANFAEYGLGWRLRDYRGRKTVSHTGGLAGMTSQITLVPAERLGIVVLTNGESNLMTALTYRLLDAFVGARPTDWVAAYVQAAQLDRARADSILGAARAARDSLSRPSLPLERYAGRYRDDLYGDAGITLESGKLALRFSRSPAFM